MTSSRLRHGADLPVFAVKLDLQHSDANYRITSYGPGRVVVNETVLERGFLLSPARLIPDWRPRQAGEISAGDLAPVLELDPEILLVGTGRRQHFLPGSVTATLLDARVGVECMDTGAACRSFMVLSSEGRRVVAAMLVE